jgi:hypothetical protein
MPRKVKSKLHITSKIKDFTWRVNKETVRKWASTQPDGNYGLLIYPMEGITLSKLHDLIIELQTDTKNKRQGTLFGNDTKTQKRR